MLGIFLDTETSGLDPQKHRILEIAYKIVDLYTGSCLETFDTILFQPQDVFEKSNPLSLKINGFTQELLSQGIAEQEVSTLIKNSFKKNLISRKNSVFICQNPSFDRLFFSHLIDTETQDLLNWPYHWLDLASMYWALLVQEVKKSKKNFSESEKIIFSKDFIASQYHISPEKKPHRAINGVSHLLLCYQAVVGFPHSNE